MSGNALREPFHCIYDYNNKMPAAMIIKGHASPLKIRVLLYNLHSSTSGNNQEPLLYRVKMGGVRACVCG